jgi:hypothetical protein
MIELIQYAKKSKYQDYPISSFSLRLNSSFTMLISMALFLLRWPDFRIMLPEGSLSTLVRKRQISAFALPSSGAAAILSFRIPSGPAAISFLGAA